jgi:aminodeoxyfutalosine deaminase
VNPDPAAKIELHVHLEGTTPSTEDFTDLAGFLRIWAAMTERVRTAEHARRLVLGYAAEAARHGAVYVEGIFSCSGAVGAGRGGDLFAGYGDGAGEAAERTGVTVRLTPDIDRSRPETADEAVRLALAHVGRGVVGIGLGGDEAAAPAAAFDRAIRAARAGGLGFVPHAGESGGPEAVRDVLAYAPERIRHGIGAAGDPGLLAELAARGIVLDVCLTSNARLGAAPSVARHPLPRLAAAGIRCTVNTDDPGIFGTDLTREHALAASVGYPGADAYAAGVAGALCDEVTRRALRAGSSGRPAGTADR